MMGRRSLQAIALLGAVLVTACAPGCTEDKQTETGSTTGGSGTATTTGKQSGTQTGDPLQRYSAKVSARLDSLIGLPVQPHWKQVRAPAFNVAYKGDPGDVYYVRTLKSADIPPSLDDIDTVRDFYRKACIKEDGGIIAVDVQTVLGKNAVVYYSKQVMRGIRGYRYIARCVVPIGDGWQEVRLDAIEMGPTGGRETLVTLALSKAGKLEMEDVAENAAATPAGPPKPGSKRIKGYNFDPYDAEHNSGAMNTIADDVKYDNALPQHPLSRIRSKFPKLLEGISLQD